MINLKCQLDWVLKCPDSWLTILPGWVFQKRPAFGPEDWVKPIALPNAGTIQPTESLTRTRGRRQKGFLSASPLQLGHEFSPPLHASGSQDFRSRLESTPSARWLSGLRRTALLAFLGLQLANRNRWETPPVWVGRREDDDISKNDK